jgi:hypothetical protein
MQINMTKQVPVDVKEIRLHMKVCDRFEGNLIDAQGDTVKEYEGYVPGFFPGEHYGDYLILNIDLETGQILNWKKPSAQDLQNFITNNDE